MFSLLDSIRIRLTWLSCRPVWSTFSCCFGPITTTFVCDHVSYDYSTVSFQIRKEIKTREFTRCHDQMWQVTWSDCDNRWLSSHILFSVCVIWTCNSEYHCWACPTALDIPGCKFQGLTVCFWVSFRQLYEYYCIQWCISKILLSIYDMSALFWPHHFSAGYERESILSGWKMETEIDVIYGNFLHFTLTLLSVTCMMVGAFSVNFMYLWTKC